MRCTAASNCGCSTPTTTSTVFRPSCLRPHGPLRHRRTSFRRTPKAIKPSCAGSCARSALTGPAPRSFARRQPLLPEGSRLCQRPRLRPRRRADPDVAPPCRRSRSHTKARFKAHPGTASSAAFKGRRGRIRHALRRHQLKSATPARCTKTSTAGAATPKINQDPSGGGPHVLQRRPPTSSVSSSTLALIG